MKYFENNKCENDCLEGICQVVNNDANKIHYFKMDKNGIERIDDEIVNGFVKKYSDKCAEQNERLNL